MPPASLALAGRQRTVGARHGRPRTGNHHAPLYRRAPLAELQAVAYCAGSASKAAAHPFEQKLTVLPSCSRLAAALAGSTLMLQTGSTVVPECVEWS